MVQPAMCDCESSGGLPATCGPVQHREAQMAPCHVSQSPVLSIGATMRSDALVKQVMGGVYNSKPDCSGTKAEK
jgi:hypothetical protein